MRHQPSRVARWVAATVAPAPCEEFVLGDLEEQFDRRARHDGVRAARRWYWKQVAGLAWHRRRHRDTGGHTRRGDALMRSLMQDLRYALRLLRRQPAYALIAVASLALAIGANGVVYGMVDSFVLHPFNVPEPDRLVSVGSSFPRLDQPEGFIEQHSTHEIEDFRQARTLANLASFDIGNRAISNGTTADRALTALLFDDPLPALGRPAELGRGFTAEELAPGGPPVVIISHRIWQGLFGGDPGIVGRVVSVNSVPRTVVGVTDAATSLLGTDVWIPLGARPLQLPRGRRQFTLIARLADGVSLAEANTELATIAARTETTYGAEFPEYAGYRLRAAPWSEAITGQVSGIAALLLGAGVIVLLIACVNLAGLMLARLSVRRHEIGVRYALGAGGWQVSRLLLVEAVLLAVVAGLAGLGLTWAALRAVPGLLPNQVIDVLAAPDLNLRVVAYCALAALAAAAVVTLAPAWQARRADLQAALRGGQSAPGRQRLRRGLVVGQLALAVVMLVAAGQMLSSFARVQNTDPGFDMDRVATMRLTLAWEKYGEPGAANRFFGELVDRIQAIPGVETAAAASQFPPAENFRIQFRVDGVTPADGVIPTAFVNTVTPDYFDVLGMRLQHGRLLDERDRQGAPLAAVVNEAFMHRYLDGRPEGRLLVGDDELAADVVGVVADARNASMLREAQPEIFATIDQVGGSNQYFLLARTAGEPMQAMPAIREALGSLDPEQPLYVIQSMEDAVAGSLFPQRVALVLVGVFAAGALVIAAIGIYGVAALFVAARAREIGIRLALGATAGAVRRTVVGHLGWLLGVGAALGLVGGIFAARAAGAALYESRAIEPLAIAAVIGVLLVVGLAAGWLPARRATRVDPVSVLRQQ